MVGKRPIASEASAVVTYGLRMSAELTPLPQGSGETTRSAAAEPSSSLPRTERAAETAGGQETAVLAGDAPPPPGTEKAAKAATVRETAKSAGDAPPPPPREDRGGG